MPPRVETGRREPSLLRAEDLLAPESFERLRPRLRPAIAGLRAARRCRIREDLTISFENRETVLWHVHEVLRIEGRTTAHQIDEEVRRYDCLVPRAGELRATLMVDGGDRDASDRLSRLVASRSGVLSLVVGDKHALADCVEPEPWIDSPIRYVRFSVSSRGIEPLDFLTHAVSLRLHVPVQTSTAVPSAVREALATDLNVNALLEQEVAYSQQEAAE